MGVAPRRQAHPLTVTEIAQILKRIDTSTPIGIRDRAVILLGYASAMRPGEVSALDVGDIITKPAGILINVRRSKTDQDARGQLVGVARGDNRLTDPIRALDDWLGIRPTGPGALFTRVIYPGRVTNERIGPRAVSRLVQERAIAAGFDGIPVTGHSLRAGHATTAAVNGAPIDRIAAQTRRRDLGTCSTTTSDQRKLSRRRPAATSACDPRRAERVGVKGFRPHRLRYTAAHRWLAASGSESGLMAIAGWSRADMLVRYDRARVSERAADEARRLNLGAIRHGPIHPQGSAKLLGEPDENTFRPADVAEPVRVFVLDHVTTDQLRTVLAEPGERLVDVVHCEHDAEVPQSVHRGFAVICDNVRREKVREFEPAVAVRRAHHGDLDALVAEAGDTPCPLPFDVGSPFEFEAEFAEELDRAGEVLDDDADIVHPESHLASLWEQQHRDDKMLL
jgi:integrase